MLHEYRVKKKDLERTLAWLIRQLHAYVMLEQRYDMNHLGDQGRLVEGFDITRLSRKATPAEAPATTLAKHTCSAFQGFDMGKPVENRAGVLTSRGSRGFRGVAVPGQSVISNPRQPSLTPRWFMVVPCST